MIIAIVLAIFLTGCVKNKGEKNIVVIETGMGEIKIKLFENEAPITTSNFKRLVNDSFYNGLIFHRIVNNFVIQGGAFYPNGTYKPSPYGTIKLEVSPNLKHDDGAVGMARTSDPNSASSQFYICVGPQHELDGQYAVFGKVVKGMDVVRAIASLDPDHTTSHNGMPNWPENDILDKVTMTKVYLE
ncbi:MAG: peptidylprolyl isomerase [Thermoplasmata archaeon]|nr:peptidylprolyl isomerase [Thermoplasmata archaeon]